MSTPAYVGYTTPRGRAIVLAAVLGSGMTILDGTVVNIALRAIGKDLDASLAELQWINEQRAKLDAAPAPKSQRSPLNMWSRESGFGFTSTSRATPAS